MGRALLELVPPNRLCGLYCLLRPSNNVKQIGKRSAENAVEYTRSVRDKLRKGSLAHGGGNRVVVVRQRCTSLVPWTNHTSPRCTSAARLYRSILAPLRATGQQHRTTSQRCEQGGVPHDHQHRNTRLGKLHPSKRHQTRLVAFRGVQMDT